MKHTLVAWVEDKPGVLTRVASLFRRRSFNIESLTVGHTEIPHISRMTIVAEENEITVEQVIKQLYKLINVTKIDPKGTEVPASAIKSVNAGSDSVDVTWNYANMPGGIYTFHIIEKTPWGCTGEEYTQDIVVNTPEVYVPISSFLNTKDNLINLCKGKDYELEVQLKDGKRTIATSLSKWMDLKRYPRSPASH